MAKATNDGAVIKVQQLVAHQDEVLVIVHRILALLTENAGDCAALGRHRWELVRATRAYQLFKHWQVFDPAIASGVRWQVDRGMAMKRACVSLGDDFRAHVLTWSGMDVLSHWQDYRRDMLLIGERLIRHLEVERRDAALLLEAERPAPRRRPPARRYPVSRPAVRSARAASLH